MNDIYIVLFIVLVGLVPWVRRRKHSDWHLVSAVAAYIAIFAGVSTSYAYAVELLEVNEIVSIGDDTTNLEIVVGVIGYVAVIGSWMLAEYVITRPPSPLLAKVFRTGEPKI